MKHLPLHASLRSRVLALALLAVLAGSPAVVSVTAHAQEAAASQTSGPAVAGDPSDPRTAETPKKEESQEETFLNGPVVHKIADMLHMREPVVRDILLLINFAIIFFAIVIPLSRMMPKIFRKRAQNLRFNLDEARKASEEARQRMSAVEAKLAGLDKEIAAYRAQVEQDSLADEQRIKASIKEETERIVASAEQEINVAAAHARHSLQVFAADLAIENASRQLKLTPEADRKLISEFIGQVAGDAAGKGGSK